MNQNTCFALLACALLVPVAACGPIGVEPISSSSSTGAGAGGSTTSSGTGGATTTTGTGGSAPGDCAPACGTGAVCVEGSCHAITQLDSASAPGSGCNLVVDATNVYWQTNEVRRVSKTGGQATSFAWTGSPASLVVDAQYLYYTGTSTGINRADKTSGSFGQPFADEGGSPTRMAGDGTSLYYFDDTNGANVYATPTGNPTDPPTLFSAEWSGFGTIAVDATSVYFWDNVGYALDRLDKTTQAKTLLAEEGVGFDLYIDASAAIVPDGDTVYYSTSPAPGVGGVVARVSANGGASTVVVDSSMGATGVLAVDDTSVYFMTVSAVMKVAKGGGTPVTLTVLDPPSPFFTCMAVDADNVYWVDGSRLLKYAK